MSFMSVSGTVCGWCGSFVVARFFEGAWVFGGGGCAATGPEAKVPQLSAIDQVMAAGVGPGPGFPALAGGTPDRDGHALSCECLP